MGGGGGGGACVPRAESCVGPGSRFPMIGRTRISK
jgi:hypothetical protein